MRQTYETIVKRDAEGDRDEDGNSRRFVSPLRLVPDEISSRSSPFRSTFIVFSRVRYILYILCTGCTPRAAKPLGKSFVAPLHEARALALGADGAGHPPLRGDYSSRIAYF